MAYRIRVEGYEFGVATFPGQITDVRQRVEHDLHEESATVFLPGGRPVQLPSSSMSATHLQRVRIDFGKGQLSLDLPGGCDASVGDKVSLLANDRDDAIGWVNHATGTVTPLIDPTFSAELGPFLQASNPVKRVLASLAMFGWKLFAMNPLLGATFWLGVPIVILTAICGVVGGMLGNFAPLTILPGIGLAGYFVWLLVLVPAVARRRLAELQLGVRQIGGFVLDEERESGVATLA